MVELTPFELADFIHERELDAIIEKMAIARVSASKLAFLREHFGEKLKLTHPFTLLLALKNGIVLKNGTRVFWNLR